MAPIRTAVHIPGDKYFPVAFGKADVGELFTSLSESAGAMNAQLLWWAHALRRARLEA